MRGEVIHYDEAQGFGFIAGVDGNRYTFRREDLRRSFPLSRGVAVEFRESGDQARDISPPITAPQVSAPATTEAPPAALAATPIAAPIAPPTPQRYGRNPVNGEAASKSLWAYFWSAITTNY